MLIAGFASCKKLPRDNPLDQYDETSPAPEQDGIKLEYSKMTVVYDDNDDDEINPGETIYLRVYIKNTGNEGAFGVNATFSTGSQYITQLDPTIAVIYNSGAGSASIYDGDEEFGYTGSTPDYTYYTIKFDVKEDTPDSTEIPFSMLIKDDTGHEWQDEFSILVTITGAHLNFSRYVVTYENNDDGLISQNETAYLRVYIINNGSAKANEVKATISTQNVYVSNLYPIGELSYNSGFGNSDISPDEEEFGNTGYAPNYQDYTIKFDVDGNAPDGEEIIFNMLIKDNAGNQWQDTFTVEVKQTGAILNYSKHEVVYDNNHDGIISQNEEVYLKIFVKNNGSSRANDVKANISSANANVLDITPVGAVDYNSGSGSDYIDPGYEKYGKYGYSPGYDVYSLSFKVAENTPAGEELVFDMHITDEEGNEWEDSFSALVEATGALVNFNRHEVVYDDGNDDGKINPNETVYLKVWVKNKGVSRANEVRGVISTTNTFVSDLTPSQEVGYNSGSTSDYINPGYEKFGRYGYTPGYHSYSVSFKVAENASVGTEITLNMLINDAEGNEWLDAFVVTIE